MWSQEDILELLQQQEIQESLYVCGAFALTSYIIGLMTKKYSSIDRIWSIAPCIYAWIFVQNSTNPLSKVLAMEITIWGTRLSYNFYRKGGYSLEAEDYRWPIVKKSFDSVSKHIWEPFHLGFIILFQSFLLWLLPLPLYFAKSQTNAQNQWFQILLVALFIILETIADEQQWRFQNRKKFFQTVKKPHPNFLTSGLFGYSRHPNFISEMMIWWCVYFFSMDHCFWNEWMLGTVLLTLLFQGSTHLTEQITVSKYPEYKEYQKRVPRLVPF